MRILDILKARKLGYQTLHNTTDMLLAKKVSGGSYEDVTVSGNPIAITEAKGGLAKALTVDMLPIQDLHGYDKPWAGGSGKNKCDNSTLSVGYYLADGRYDSNEHFRTSDFIPVLPSTEYSTSFFDKSKQRVGILVVTLWDSNKAPLNTQITTSPFTTTIDTAFVRVRNFNSQSSYIDTDDYLFQLELGSTATSYEPYSNICPISGRNSLDITVNGNTETISLGETVYGGTCDVVNGETSVEWKMVDLGSFDWHYIAQYSVFWTDGITDEKKASGITVKCSAYKPTNNVETSSNITEDKTICLYIGSDENLHRIYVKDTSYNDENVFKSAVNGYQLCYELATPTTLTTPATSISLNKGNNTLSTSGDNMDLKYSTTISNPTSLTMARPTLSLSSPTVEEPTEETDER